MINGEDIKVMNDKEIKQFVKNNLKILINKSTDKNKSINASKDFIRQTDSLNLSKVCVNVTKLIFNEEICSFQKPGEINEAYAFQLIDHDSLSHGLLKIYDHILKHIKLEEDKRKTCKNYISNYIIEYGQYDDNNNWKIILKKFDEK